MSELTEAIIKIVKSDPEIGSALGIAVNPPKIYSRRGIAYVNPDGSLTTVGGSDAENVSAPGAEQESDPANAESPEDQDAPGTSYGGGGTGGGGGGSGTTGDVEDLFGESGSASQGEQIATLTGTDPIDGGATSFDLNRPCGAEYDAPPDWNDPDTPAIQSEDDLRDYTRKLHSFCVQEIGYNPQNYDPPGSPWDGKIRRSDGYPWLDGRFYWQDSWNYSATGITEASLDAELEKFSNHPSDGECKIAYDCAAGGYKGHAKDTDCTAEQLTAKAARYFTSATDPTKHYRVQRLNDGGSKVTPVEEPVYDSNGNLTSGGAPVPGGVSVTTDADGRVNGYYDSASQVWVK